MISKRGAPLAVKGQNLLFLIPYLAMVVGLYGLHSAWISFVIYHGLVAVTVGPDSQLRMLLLRGWHTPAGIGALVFGLAGGVMILALAPTAGIDSALINPALAKLGLAGPGFLLFVIYHALVNPWFEELLWRGKLGSNALRPVSGDFLFAGYHVLVLVLFLAWQWVAVAFVMLSIAGWFWRQLKRRYDGLLLPVISHMAADVSIMMVVYLLSRSIDKV